MTRHFRNLRARASRFFSRIKSPASAPPRPLGQFGVLSQELRNKIWAEVVHQDLQDEHAEPTQQPKKTFWQRLKPKKPFWQHRTSKNAPAPLPEKSTVASLKATSMAMTGQLNAAQEWHHRPVTIHAWVNLSLPKLIYADVEQSFATQVILHVHLTEPLPARPEQLKRSTEDFASFLSVLLPAVTHVLVIFHRPTPIYPDWVDAICRVYLKHKTPLLFIDSLRNSRQKLARVCFTFQNSEESSEWYNYGGTGLQIRAFPWGRTVEDGISAFVRGN